MTTAENLPPRMAPGDEGLHEDFPRYPEVLFDLIEDGPLGNSMSIVGAVGAALRRYGVPADERKRFHTEALSGNRQKVIDTVHAWVTVTT